MRNGDGGQMKHSRRGHMLYVVRLNGKVAVLVGDDPTDNSHAVDKHVDVLGILGKKSREDIYHAITGDCPGYGMAVSFDSPIFEVLVREQKALGEFLAQIATDFFAAGEASGKDQMQHLLEGRILSVLRGTYSSDKDDENT